MNMIIIKNIQGLSSNVIYHSRIFLVLFKLMTFTIKSEYGKWFDITIGLLVWLNVIIIIYFIYIGLK